MNRPRTSGLLRFCFAPLVFLAVSCFAIPAQAAPVSYAAQLETSKHNPVTDILILEEDSGGTVHGTVYGQDITGNGYAVINHNPAYEAVRSLVVGLTDGEDEFGDPKVQLVMFVADGFAASKQGLPYSEAFPGAKHSLTIESLLAAVAGDATQMAWFTDTFFTGPAAQAVFDTHGSFSVAEFTTLDTIGGAIAVGPWILNVPFVALGPADPGAQDNRPTGVLDETANDEGPFDIEFSVDDDGVFAVDKTVVNGTDLVMVTFTVEVGSGTGENFVPTVNPGPPVFTNLGSTEETTGAFPDATSFLTSIVWEGSLAPGGEARFIFFVSTNVQGPHDVTVRQTATYATADARATFTVTKDFTDGNPSEVEVTINCFTGLPLNQSQDIAEGDKVTFVVTDFDAGELDCDVSETGAPDGYSATYGIEENEGGEAGDITEDEDGCHFEDVVTGEFACQVTNTPDPVDIVIHKEWVIEGSEGHDIDTRYKLTLWCDGEIIGGEQIGFGVEAPAAVPSGCLLSFPGVEAGQTVAGGNWCKEFDGEGSDTFVAEVIPIYPESDCEVIETVYDSSVEIDNDCGFLEFRAGEGAECTITNTVFFEGIPTLNQYGVAILALLMLGVGVAGFRRFA